MPRLPEINAPNQVSLDVPTPQAPPATTQASEALGSLGKQISDIAYNFTQKKIESDNADYVYKTNLDLQQMASDNLDRLQKQNPEGNGVYEAQSQYVEQIFADAQKNAPTEAARTKLVQSTRPDLSVNLSKTKNWQENTQMEVKMVRTADNMGQQATELSQTGDVDRLISLRNANELNITEQTKAGLFDFKSSENLRNINKELSFHTAKGILEQMELAKGTPQVKNSYAHLKNLLQVGGTPKDTYTGVIGRDLKPGQSEAIMKEADRIIEKKNNESKFNVTYFGQQLRQNGLDGGDTSATEKDYNSWVSSLDQTNMPPLQKAVMYTNTTSARAYSDIYNRYIVNSASSKQDIAGAAQEFAAMNEKIQEDAAKKYGIKASPELLGLESTDQILQRLYKDQAGENLARQKTMAAHAYGVDPEFRNLADQAIQTDVNGMITINPEVWPQYLNKVSQIKAAWDSPDNNVLTPQMVTGFAKTMGHNGQMSAAMINSIDSNTPDLGLRNAVYDQLGKPQKLGGIGMKPELTIAGLMPNQFASETVANNVMNKEAISVQGKNDLEAHGSSEKKIDKLIGNDADVREKIALLTQGKTLDEKTLQSNALTEALKLETMRIYHGSYNPDTAFESAKANLGFSGDAGYKVYNFDDVNDTGFKILIPGKHLPAEEQNVNNYFRTTFDPEYLKQFNFDMPAEFRARKEKVWDSGLAYSYKSENGLYSNITKEQWIKDQWDDEVGRFSRPTLANDKSGWWVDFNNGEMVSRQTVGEKPVYLKMKDALKGNDYFGSLYSADQRMKAEAMSARASKNSAKERLPFMNLPVGE